MENEQKNIPEDQVQFNLGQSQLYLLSSLLEKAASHFTETQIFKWFIAMKSIRLQITARLSDKELHKCKELEVLCNKYSIEARDGSQTSYSKAFSAIEIYDELIKKLLETKGFMIPSKQDQTMLFGQKRK